MPQPSPQNRPGRSLTQHPAALRHRRWLTVGPRHLAAFIAVAEEGSFRCAARHLCSAESAVRHEIGLLERALGVRLVQRRPGTTTLSLTAAGRTLLPHACGVMERLHVARIELSAIRPQCDGLGSWHST
jgi:DNA-binding transcriptional LysR family regulator